MSLSSIRARAEAATEGNSFIVEAMWGNHGEACPYSGEWDSEDKPDPTCPACQCISLVHRDIPLLLKVAEAVHNWREEKAQFWANAGTASYAYRLLKREAEMAVALAELEAGE